MKKIVFYGDSNTYGYDPRGFMGMRYPEEIIWTSLVQKHFGDTHIIINHGQNGRILPSLPRDEAFLEDITCDLSGEDIFVIMLGTNDILLTDHPNPLLAIEKMDRFVNWYKNRQIPAKLIVIGPIYIDEMSGNMAIYHDASINMNTGFSKICKTHGIIYHDAGRWSIPTAFDGVHFSEEGHQIFSRHMINVLEQ